VLNVRCHWQCSKEPRKQISKVAWSCFNGNAIPMDALWLGMTWKIDKPEMTQTLGKHTKMPRNQPSRKPYTKVISLRSQDCDSRAIYIGHRRQGLIWSLQRSIASGSASGLATKNLSRNSCIVHAVESYCYVAYKCSRWRHLSVSCSMRNQKIRARLVIFAFRESCAASSW